MEEQTPEEVAEVLQPYFEGTDKKLIAMSVERYLGQYTWPKDPTLTKEQYDLLEKTLLENGVIKEEERVNYEDAVDTTFSKKAMQ